MSAGPSPKAERKQTELRCDAGTRKYRIPLLLMSFSRVRSMLTLSLA